MAIPVVSVVVRIMMQLRSTCRRTYWTYAVRRRAGSCGDALCVNMSSTVSRRTFLGSNVNFNGMQIRGGGVVKIGSYFHSGIECMMLTSFHNYDKGSRIPYGPREDDIHLDIEIGDCVWFGDRVIVLGGVKIGEGAVIQAGSVVVGDIPAMAIAGGHPAKVFKYRDREHFLTLKAKGMFL
jgi:acetyltransferase-like isoleucine patch superfamily enzyme